MSEREDDPLYRDPELVQFYDVACTARADFEYCYGLVGDGTSVLDLGCGTGDFATSLTGDRVVTGIDPAGAMLNVARKRPGGDKVTWVEADARDVRLEARFDLIILTGHSYQVFLSDDDQRAVLATIAAHLNSDGRFVFDSRNPGFSAPKSRHRDDNPRDLNHPELGQVQAWNQSEYDESAGVLTYENGYRVLETGKDYSAIAKIRYTPKDKLAEMIVEAGLVVDEWLGDWHGAAWTPNSKEIIPVGRLA